MNSPELPTEPETKLPRGIRKITNWITRQLAQRESGSADDDFDDLGIYAGEIPAGVVYAKRLNRLEVTQQREPDIYHPTAIDADDPNRWYHGPPRRDLEHFIDDSGLYIGEPEYVDGERADELSPSRRRP